tara:strand:+ start:283 stop:522 length:240 start_codon:yes stop_codon:yes gene_type:complete
MDVLQKGTEVDEDEFIYLAVNIGDCKAYVYRESEGSFQDITVGNRLEVRERKEERGEEKRGEGEREKRGRMVRSGDFQL